jgi:hypothetical protein
MPAGDITQGYIFVPAEKSIDQVKMNAIVGQAYINPAFISAQTESTSSTTGDYFLLLKSGGTLAKIVLDNLANSLATTTGFQSSIWSVRLKSFNSVQNCNFEVDQRNVHTAVVNPASGTFICDRWLAGNNTLNPSFRSIQTGLGAGQGIPVPGTSYIITTAEMIITVGTQKVSLAAGDHVDIGEQIEGPSFRELMSDVHSVSILARSSVANLKFGLALRDPTASRSLTKLCTLGAANTLSLIQLPNLPLWPSAGTFTAGVGSLGYMLNICVAAGSTFISPANDTWQNGNFLGAVGQDNLLATAGATFEVFFVQHEPGSQCTTLMDCPFSGPNGNLEACQRYYDKSYDYLTKAGTAAGSAIMLVIPANAHPYSYIPFKKTMAKIPTVTGYSTTTGAVNNVRDVNAAVDRAISSVNATSSVGFGGMSLSALNASNTNYTYHYTADTGW